MVASGGFRQLLAAAEAQSHERSGKLSMGRPRTVWKGHRHSLMPFQKAYIKAEGFRVGCHLLLIVCLLVLVSLTVE